VPDSVDDTYAYHRTTATSERCYAALDLGSNSFHLLLMCYDHNGWRRIAEVKRRVQLAAALDTNNCINSPALLRSACAIESFAQIIREHGADEIRVVGTSALRRAANAALVTAQVRTAMGCEVDIIDGREEAHLIYQGVYQWHGEHRNTLVIDAGGGSTEFIIGSAAEPDYLESVALGCLSCLKPFFAAGRISKTRLDQAITECRSILLPIRKALLKYGWNRVVACSGCFEALLQTQAALGDSHTRLTDTGLASIRAKLLQHQYTHQVQIEGLDDSRRDLLPSSLALVTAIFEMLDIHHASMSQAALKEGLIFDMHQRGRSRQLRDKAVWELLTQHRVDQAQAQRVLTSATSLWQQVSQQWSLNHREVVDLLFWAALLHELGTTVGTQNHWLHGAYLLDHCELRGFSKWQQHLLATLVGGQTGALNSARMEPFDADLRTDGWCLLRILRLALLLRRNREDSAPATLTLTAHGNDLFVTTSSSTHPDAELFWADLIKEASYQTEAGFRLSIQGNLNLLTF